MIQSALQASRLPVGSERSESSARSSQASPRTATATSGKCHGVPLFLDTVLDLCAAYDWLAGLAVGGGLPRLRLPPCSPRVLGLAKRSMRASPGAELPRSRSPPLGDRGPEATELEDLVTFMNVSLNAAIAPAAPTAI